MNSLQICALALVLTVAAMADVRSGTIPNTLVLAGTVLALALRGVSGGGPSVMVGVWGLSLALAVGFPIYMLRAVGAGDVKLLATVGAFVGSGAMPLVLGATAIAGGALAMAVAIRHRKGIQLISNTRALLLLGASDLSSGRAPNLTLCRPSVGTLPYAVAIALGVCACGAWTAGFGAYK